MIQEAKQEVTYFLRKSNATPITPISRTPTASGIQSGLVTQSQLQLMFPVNLRIRNTINNVVPTPIPLDVLLSVMLFVCYLVHDFKYLVWRTPSTNVIMFA